MFKAARSLTFSSIMIIERVSGMKHIYLVIIVLCLFFAVQGSRAQERAFGLGVIVGEPTGLSAKLWTSSTNAFDFGLGRSIGGGRMGGGKPYYSAGRGDSP